MVVSHIYTQRNQSKKTNSLLSTASLYLYIVHTHLYTQNWRFSSRDLVEGLPVIWALRLFNSCVTCNLDSLALSAWNKGQPSVLSSATSWQGGYRARSPPSALPEEDPSAACGSPHKKLQWGERSSSWCLASAWSLEMTTEKYFTLEIPRFLVCLLVVCLCF